MSELGDKLPEPGMQKAEPSGVPGPPPTKAKRAEKEPMFLSPKEVVDRKAITLFSTKLREAVEGRKIFTPDQVKILKEHEHKLHEKIPADSPEDIQLKKAQEDIRALARVANELHITSLFNEPGRMEEFLRSDLTDERAQELISCMRDMHRAYEALRPQLGAVSNEAERIRMSEIRRVVENCDKLLSFDKVFSPKEALKISLIVVDDVPHGLDLWKEFSPEKFKKIYGYQAKGFFNDLVFKGEKLSEGFRSYLSANYPDRYQDLREWPVPDRPPVEKEEPAPPTLKPIPELTKSEFEKQIFAPSLADAQAENRPELLYEKFMHNLNDTTLAREVLTTLSLSDEQAEGVVKLIREHIEAQKKKKLSEPEAKVQKEQIAFVRDYEALLKKYPSPSRALQIAAFLLPSTKPDSKEARARFNELTEPFDQAKFEYFVTNETLFPKLSKQFLTGDMEVDKDSPLIKFVMEIKIPDTVCGDIASALGSDVERTYSSYGYPEDDDIDSLEPLPALRQAIHDAKAEGTYRSMKDSQDTQVKAAVYYYDKLKELGVSSADALQCANHFAGVKVDEKVIKDVLGKIEEIAIRRIGKMDRPDASAPVRTFLEKAPFSEKLVQALKKNKKAFPDFARIYEQEEKVKGGPAALRLALGAH